MGAFDVRVQKGAGWMLLFKLVERSLGLISSLGLKCGVVLNPSTPTSYLENIMGKVDIILLMSVNPGFGGQKFIPATLDKAREARKMIDEVRDPPPPWP